MHFKQNEINTANVWATLGSRDQEGTSGLERENGTFELFSKEYKTTSRDEPVR